VLVVVLAEVGFRAEKMSALELAVYVGWVEMHLFICISSVSVDFLRRHFGKECIRPCGFDEALLRVFLSLPSTVYAQNTQQRTFSFLGLQREVS
jgi:hypothetical protein